jgi:hypothetical protein
MNQSEIYDLQLLQLLLGLRAERDRGKHEQIGKQRHQIVHRWKSMALQTQILSVGGVGSGLVKVAGLLVWCRQY